MPEKNDRPIFELEDALIENGFEVIQECKDKRLRFKMWFRSKIVIGGIDNRTYVTMEWLNGGGCDMFVPVTTKNAIQPLLDEVKR